MLKKRKLSAFSTGLLVLIAVWLCFIVGNGQGSGYNAARQITFTATGSDVTLQQNSLMLYHKIIWTDTNVSTCSATVDSSTDGAAWTTGGVISAQNCSANGASAIVASTANYIRVTVSTLTGAGASVIIQYQGWAYNPTPGTGTGTVTSVTFTGDGTVLSSTPSAAVTTSGTVPATLANAAAGSVLNNGTAAAAAPGYTQTPTLGAVGGSTGTVTYLGTTSGSQVAGCTSATCIAFGGAATPALYKSYFTGANCAANGTAAQPSVVSCTSAPAGRFSCSVSATASCQVNTTAITGASDIVVIQTANTAVGTALGVTCNTTASTLLPMVTSQVNATSFTIQLTQPVTNPDCFTYFIVN